jgi:bifunctional enzyme CysN/CysC
MTPDLRRLEADSIRTLCGLVAEFKCGNGAFAAALSGEAEAGRDGTLARAPAASDVSDQYAVYVIWMDAEDLVPERLYLCRVGTKTVSAVITAIRYRIDPNTRLHLAADTLASNQMAFCNLATADQVAFDPDDRKSGSFVIIDRFSNRTVGAGIIAFGLRRGENVPWQKLLVSKSERAALKTQKPAILWFTGLSGAGKSTIANLVEQRLHGAGHHTMLLDGDNVRHGLNRDLGFTEADRVENIRRAGEVAKLMLEGGLIVLCSFISPYRAEREMVRSLVPVGEFIEVYVDTPLDECMRRDPKGLYAKAKAGAIKNFTGFDAPYEVPSAPDLHLHTVDHNPEALAERVFAELVARALIVNRRCMDGRA